VQFQKISIPTPRMEWKFQGGGAFQKPIFLKESMTLEWNFPRGGGGGSSYESFHGRGMDIFWNNTK